jgi:hypothetical protein
VILSTTPSAVVKMVEREIPTRPFTSVIAPSRQALILATMGVKTSAVQLSDVRYVNSATRGVIVVVTSVMMVWILSHPHRASRESEAEGTGVEKEEEKTVDATIVRRENVVKRIAKTVNDSSVRKECEAWWSVKSRSSE